jgi:MerR family transcriptional regulator, copper efflux regulator
MSERDGKGFESYRIGEASKILGLSIDTLRYYEKIGLLKPVSRNGSGMRIYDRNDIFRLAFIQRAKTMKFTLEEIATLLELRDEPQSARNDIRELTRRKLAEVEMRIKELDALRCELSILIDRCCQSRHGCPIIEEIDHSKSAN